MLQLLDSDCGKLAEAVSTDTPSVLPSATGEGGCVELILSVFFKML